LLGAHRGRMRHPRRSCQLHAFPAFPLRRWPALEEAGTWHQHTSIQEAPKSFFNAACAARNPGSQLAEAGEGKAALTSGRRFSETGARLLNTTAKPLVLAANTASQLTTREFACCGSGTRADRDDARHCHRHTFAGSLVGPERGRGRRRRSDFAAACLRHIENAFNRMWPTQFRIVRVVGPGPTQPDWCAINLVTPCFLCHYLERPSLTKERKRRASS